MKTEPAIPRQQIRQHLGETYNLDIHTLEFLPVGEGAWCYRGGGDTPLFIRLAKSPKVEEKAVCLSRFLHAKGLPVLAPLPDRLGKFISEVEGFGMSVYPFIEGATLMVLMNEGALTETEVSRFRGEIGGIIAALHRVRQVDAEKLHLPTEDFSRFQAESLAIIHMEAVQQRDTLTDALADFVSVRRTDLEHLIATAQRLGSKLRSEKLDNVLCHGDIHEANVLVSHEGALFLVDWDNAVLAPKERDLMFFGGDGLSDYLEGYFGGGFTPSIHQAAIDYYVLEWALQEIVDYGSRILFDARFDADGRLDAWQQFQRLFEPGQDVDAALALIRAKAF